MGYKYATEAEAREAQYAHNRAADDWYKNQSPLTLTEGEEYHGVDDMHCHVDLPELLSTESIYTYYDDRIWGDRSMRPYAATRVLNKDRSIDGSLMRIDTGGLAHPHLMTGLYHVRRPELAGD